MLDTLAPFADLIRLLAVIAVLATGGCVAAWMGERRPDPATARQVARVAEYDRAARAVRNRAAFDRLGASANR